MGQTADNRSDAELIAAVRSGDSSAFAALWSRHHPAVLRYALQFPPRSNAEDLVSEAFARLLRVLQAGGGPDMNVRPYLLTAVKRLRIDVATRYERRVGLTDDDTDLEIEAADPAEAKAMEGLEASLVWKAYGDLPERWQLVLWHTLIEEQPAAEVASILGSSPNAIAALSMRAREGLRQAFLQAHVGRSASSACVPVLGRLGAWQRRALSNREAVTVSKHLDDCPDCRSAAAELGRLNQSLRSIVLPVVLGGIGSASAFLSDAVHTDGPAPTTAAQAHRAAGRPRHGTHGGTQHLARIRAEVKPVLLSAAALVVVVTTFTTLATMPKRPQRLHIALLPTSSASATPAGSHTTVVDAPTAVPAPTEGTSTANNPPGGAAGVTASSRPRPLGGVVTSPNPPPGAGATSGGAAAGVTEPVGPAGSLELVPLPAPGATSGATDAASTGSSGGGTGGPSVRPEATAAAPSPSATPSSATGGTEAVRALSVRVVTGERPEAGSLHVMVPANWRLVAVTAYDDDVCLRVSSQQFDCTVAPLPPPGKHFYTVAAESEQSLAGDELIAEYIWGGHLQRHHYDLT